MTQIPEQTADPRLNCALVVGASGGIGEAVLRRLLHETAYDRVLAVSRQPCPWELQDRYSERLSWLQCSYDESSIARFCETIDTSALDLRRVIICNGVLHGDNFSPEKNLESLSGKALHEVFEANAVVPVLWLQQLLRQVRRCQGCKIAILSARVGSIGDNALGGWYAYRSSKAALNMLLKTAAIEYRRRAPGVKLVAFHPGTTDTALSAPFQRGVPEGKLFSPDFVAERLLALLDNVPDNGELSFLDWDGKPVPW